MRKHTDGADLGFGEEGKGWCGGLTLMVRGVWSAPWVVKTMVVKRVSGNGRRRGVHLAYFVESPAPGRRNGMRTKRLDEADPPKLVRCRLGKKRRADRDSAVQYALDRVRAVQMCTMSAVYWLMCPT